MLKEHKRERANMLKIFGICMAKQCKCGIKETIKMCCMYTEKWLTASSIVQKRKYKDS